MCATCGCGNHQHETVSTMVSIQEKVVAKNDGLAASNRAWLTQRNIVALNLMSSPGSGKTTLLERTITQMGDTRPVAVVEGDQATSFDADRIRRTGCAVVQINTGAGCHLDAAMMHGALHDLAPRDGSLLFVENVGNLVCPALFDLGETAKVVVVSVTEGTDKPLKYPHMFAVADLVLVNKIDLAPYVDFELERCVGYARSVNPGVEALAVSAKTGAGLDAWYNWIRAKAGGVR